jgi:hypothetical protein
MTDEQIALSKRAVACKGFRWVPGMRAMCVEEPPFVSEEFDASKLLGRTCRVYEVSESGSVRGSSDTFRTTSTAYAPDLSDPATLGCLLALVREAWGQDDVGASRYKERWCVERWCVDIRVFRYGTYGDTEAEALVAALEGAP